MNYKMIVLDLDGTLTNRDKIITPRTKQSLMEAQKRGLKVVLASGRPTYGVMPLAEELGLEGAKRVNPGWLSGGAYLLNTDGFHLGRAIVGAAGGRRETYTRPLNPVPAPAYSGAGTKGAGRCPDL